MTVQDSLVPIVKLAIRFEPDIVTARQKTRRLAELLGFENQDQVRLATAVSELARNVFQYAGFGHLEFLFSTSVPQMLVVRVSDKGPGMSHLQEILDGTYVSASGMGIGLSGTKKLMDLFELVSAPGKGTEVTIGKLVSKRARPIKKEDIGRIAGQLIDRQMASPFEEMQSQNRDLMHLLEAVNVARQELEEVNRELTETNRGVVALYAELDEKAASLQRANEVKTSFLSNMTHEFRTPLSSVISLTRLLLNRTDGDLSPEQERQVNYIRQSSEGLLELVSDLLDLAKVEAGKVSIHQSEFFIDDILGGLRGMFRPLLISKSDVALDVILEGENFSLNSDHAKISQVLRNLISNAIKFTERGTITVRAWREKPGTVRFAVSDTGAGIDAKNLDIIFEDFSQIDSQLQSRHRGTGLGLPLSKKLAKVLGGDLWVESRVGEGSTFHVALPSHYSGTPEAVLFHHNPVETQPPSEAFASSLESGEKFRILIVDDDEPSRYVLKNLLLSEFEADFRETVNGVLGLELIRQWRPDAVFLDLSMPEIDGFEMLRLLYGDPVLISTPIIIYTAKQLTWDEAHFLERQSTAVLSKNYREPIEAVRNLRAALSKAGFDYQTRTTP